MVVGFGALDRLARIMARKVVNRKELREEVEAAERAGLVKKKKKES